MALMVAAILLTVLSPLVVLSTSYRVQARRIDLATQAARSYIDGLRSDSIGPPSYKNADFSVNTPNEVGVPAPATKTPADGIDVGNCLDKNLNSLPDCDDPANKPFLVIQAFRNRIDIDAADNDRDGKYDPIPGGYCVGVRVYRGDAFDGTTLTTQPPKSGLSNSQYAPLVVMRAEIINQTSFQGYAERFPPAATAGEPAAGSPCG